MEPNERLRVLLRLERQRGMGFDDAWARCTAVVAQAQASPARWLEIFEWSREAWRRAYEEAPRICVDWLERAA